MNRVVIAACFVGLIFVGRNPARAADQDYPRADLLVEVGQLAQPEFAANFVILDARPRAKYQHAHLPQARFVDHQAWAGEFGHGEDAAGWSRRIGTLGISAKSRVIVYDDALSRDAARIWWILKYWGVEDVRLLNGGWRAWLDADKPIENTDASFSATPFVAKPHSARLATKDRLLKSLGGGALQIVDARSEREFCGFDKMRNKRGGAIPGAKQLEWVDLLNQKTQRFKSASELQQLFESAGIALDRPTATHCQSGGRSSVMAFGLELMGAKNVGNYYPSWAEWSSASDTPVVPGRPRPKH